MDKPKILPSSIENIVSCGLVMPISAIDGCSCEHWIQVKSIIHEAVDTIASPKFKLSLVSESDDISVIQKRIVQNIYNSNIIVCDVSAKNPNVMFELGMRLAFDKPTVIIKDDKTDYSFDTGIIEHVTYPRDLNYSSIVAFKTTLSKKISATYNAAQSDPSYSTFLKNFGKFKVASPSESIGSPNEIIMEMLNDLQSQILKLQNISMRGYSNKYANQVDMFTEYRANEINKLYNICFDEDSDIDYKRKINYILKTWKNNAITGKDYLIDNDMGSSK